VGYWLSYSILKFVTPPAGLASTSETCRVVRHATWYGRDQNWAGGIPGSFPLTELHPVMCQFPLCAAQCDPSPPTLQTVAGRMDAEKKQTTYRCHKLKFILTGMMNACGVIPVNRQKIKHELKFTRHDMWPWDDVSLSDCMALLLIISRPLS